MNPLKNVLLLGLFAFLASCSSQKLAISTKRPASEPTASSKPKHIDGFLYNQVKATASTEVGIILPTAEERYQVAERSNTIEATSKRISTWQKIKLAHKINKAIIKSSVSKSALMAKNELTAKSSNDSGGFNIASFVLSILGIYPLLWGLGLLAVIFGIIGLAKEQSYQGLGIVGIILGALEFALFLVVILFLSIFGF
jgi:hypothetical protein